MNSRLQLIGQIRQESLTEGIIAALATARHAVDEGRLAAPDVPEVFLALRSGDWRHLLSAETTPAAFHIERPQAAA